MDQFRLRPVYYATETSFNLNYLYNKYILCTNFTGGGGNDHTAQISRLVFASAVRFLSSCLVELIDCL